MHGQQNVKNIFEHVTACLLSSKKDVLLIVRQSMKMYEEVKDSSTHSLFRHDLEVIGQFDALPRCSRVKFTPPLPPPSLKILRETGWTQVAVWAV